MLGTSSIFLSLLSNGLLGGGGGQSMSSPGDIGGGNGTGTPTGGGGKGTGHLKLLHGGHTALRHGRRIIHEGNTGSGGGTGGSGGNAIAASSLTAEHNQNEEPPNNMVRWHFVLLVL